MNTFFTKGCELFILQFIFWFYREEIDLQPKEEIQEVCLWSISVSMICSINCNENKFDKFGLTHFFVCCKIDLTETRIQAKTRALSPHVQLLSQLHLCTKLYYLNGTIFLSRRFHMPIYRWSNFPGMRLPWECCGHSRHWTRTAFTSWKKMCTKSRSVGKIVVV